MRRRAIAVVAASTLVLLLTGAGLALGSIPDSLGVIHGCYKDSTGALRLVDTEEGQSCKATETAIEWSQAGAIGPTGPAGPSGPPGGSSSHFIDLQLFGARISGGANFTTGFGPHGGLQLPSSSSSGFDFQFAIPPDFQTGGTLTVRVVWHTSATNCEMFLRPNSISVARVGRVHIIGEFAGTGLEGVGGDLLQAPGTPNTTQEKLYTIMSPVVDTPLQAGDNVIFGLFRDLREGNTDTCAANLTIQGVSISY